MYLSRWFDFSIFNLILIAISCFLPFFYEPWFHHFSMFVAIFLWALIDAIFIVKKVTTPGKALFGVTVQSNQKLSLIEALKWSLFPNKSIVFRQAQASGFRKFFRFIITLTVFITNIYVYVLWGENLNKVTKDKWWMHLVRPSHRSKYINHKANFMKYQVLGNYV